MLRLPNLPIRLLLVLALAAMPLLCCCGKASAEPAVQRSASAHACCESKNERPANHQDSDDCQCKTRVQASLDVKTDAVPTAPEPQTFNPLFFPPLPRFLAAVLPENAPHHLPSFDDSAGLPAAPSLRSLSVLLLV